MAVRRLKLVYKYRTEISVNLLTDNALKLELEGETQIQTELFRMHLGTELQAQIQGGGTSCNNEGSTQ